MKKMKLGDFKLGFLQHVAREGKKNKYTHAHSAKALSSLLKKLSHKGRR